MRKRLALWLYRCLLAFYPTGFRTEFEVEMKAVFTRALAERHASMVRLLWRELRDWPGVVWSAHHAERREIMIPTNSSRVQAAPAQQPVPASSWRDAWLAALAFLFYLWYSAAGVILSALSEPLKLTKSMQGGLGGLSALAILIIEFIVVLLCWRGGWPRWSLPYLGVVLSMLTLLAQAGIRNDGSLLIFFAPLVFFLVFLLAALSMWWKGLRPLYQRLHSDWTLLGLVYFSCLPFVFLIAMNETRYEGEVDLVLFVILALGVFAYMRTTSLWSRVVVLPVAYILASLVATYYLKAYDIYWQPFFESGTFDMLTIMLLLAIAPLLAVGLFELGRYAFNRWLQAA
jgi:hypothetical protein